MIFCYPFRMGNCLNIKQLTFGTMKNEKWHIFCFSEI